MAASGLCIAAMVYSDHDSSYHYSSRAIDHVYDSNHHHSGTDIVDEVTAAFGDLLTTTTEVARPPPRDFIME